MNVIHILPYEDRVYYFNLCLTQQAMSDRHASVSVPVLGKTNKWWFQDAGLRRLYFLLLVAIMSSATNGMSERMNERCNTK